MGRSYREELSELRAAQAAVPDLVIAKLREQASLAGDRGLIVVASGGAKVVADWACQLQRTVFGSPAVALTPLEYMSLAAPVRSVTWFLSAGGRHPDIRHAARVAKERGDATVVGFVAHTDTPLALWIEEELRGEVISFDVPTGGDGFLATTSVWAMSCALAKAYGAWLDIRERLDDELFAALLSWGEEEARVTNGGLMPDRDLVILHDAWSTLGARDLETRFIETSLKNLWTSDFRNFGHGRHFWVADRLDQTSLVALWAPMSKDLAIPTLAVLPEGLAVQRVELPFDGIAGALAALAWSIFLTAAQGERVGRDPGRPGVPLFGEQLYNGTGQYPDALARDAVRVAISRKSPAIQPGSPHFPQWEAAYWRARRQFESASVSAIVADYDGTLVDSTKRFDPPPSAVVDELIRLLEAGVCFGIASGRGDSIHRDLRLVLPRPLWSKVLVGYHNGAVVAALSDPAPSLDGDPVDPQLANACALLQAQVANRGLATLKCRLHQLTITPAKGLTLLGAWRATRECLDRNALTSLGVWLSSHSVDVLGPNCAKLHVVEQVARLAGCTADAVLRIGDRGSRPGNDWSLLRAPLGLSVGDCSSDLETCWNLLPAGLHGAEATVHLLRQIRISSPTGAAS